MINRIHPMTMVSPKVEEYETMRPWDSPVRIVSVVFAMAASSTDLASDGAMFKQVVKNGSSVVIDWKISAFEVLCTKVRRLLGFCCEPAWRWSVLTIPSYRSPS